MKKKPLKILELIISFNKYLRSFYLLFVTHGSHPIAIPSPSKITSKRIIGQSALEYSLLLVVIAGIMLTFFANGFQPLKDIFNSTHNKMMERIVNGV